MILERTKHVEMKTNYEIGIRNSKDSKVPCKVLDKITNCLERFQKCTSFL